jgi:sarcosine oxidase subunit beta
VSADGPAGPGTAPAGRGAAPERLAVDVAIVGGGIAACAAALALRGRGMTVAVLEAKACGGGASGVNFGGVREQGRDLAELPLSRRARAIWDRLPALVGEDCEFRATGHLKLAYSDADMGTLERWATDARGFGVAAELLGGNRLRAAHPLIGGAVAGASLCASDGQANPRLVGPAFARAARAAGAAIREFAPVRRAVATGAGFALEADGVEVAARVAVNAAGAWADRVARWFGDDAPLKPLLPNMLVTERLPRFIDRSVGVCGGGVYVRQVERGNVVFGGGRGWGDAELDRSRPLADVSGEAMRQAVRIVPALAGALVIRSWSGIDGETQDDLPVLGPSPAVPGLIHAFGFSGHGFQLAPAVGEVIAELAADGRSATPLAAFALDRFPRGPKAASMPPNREGDRT